MSISTRLEAINQHLLDDYSVLELGGADLTNVDKNIFNLKPQWQDRLKYYLANGTDTLWNNWEKVSGSGETLSLSPTIKGKMEIGYKGNTQQNGTPTPDTPIPVQVVSGDNTIKVEGKNLIDFSNATKRGWNVLIPNPIKIAGTYTISTKQLLSHGTASVFCDSASGTIIGSYITGYDFGRTSISKTITVTQEQANAKYIEFRGNGGNEISELSSNIQLEKNSEATPYEPYQSQTYEVNLGNIELCKIGTYQDKIAKSTGKNLFNYADTFVDGITTFSVANVEPNKTYFCKAYNINDTYTSGFSMRAKINGVWTVESARQLVAGFSYTTPNNCTAIAFNGCTNPSDRVCQVEEGTSPSTYEPYGKVWYLNKQIGKATVSSFTGKAGTTRNNDYYTSAISGILRPSGGNILIPTYSNHFTQTTADNVYSYDSVGLGVNSNGTLAVGFGLSSSITTLELANQWITNNNILLYYPLATPTYEEITDSSLKEQLNNLENAMSYDSQTNISQTNDDLPFVLNVVALKEMS